MLHFTPPINNLGSPAVWTPVAFCSTSEIRVLPKEHPVCGLRGPQRRGARWRGECGLSCLCAPRRPPAVHRPPWPWSQVSVSSPSGHSVTQEASWGLIFLDTWNAAARLSRLCPRSGWLRAHAVPTPCTTQPCGRPPLSFGWRVLEGGPSMCREAATAAD